MYETLSNIANRLMAETGIRFSDLPQLQLKVTTLIYNYAADKDISFWAAASELQSEDSFVTLIQQKTKQSVVIQVTATVLQEVEKMTQYTLKLSDLKYTTYRAIQTKCGNYHKTRTGKKLTIAHKKRHDKAKEVFEETNSEAEAAAALGISLKTLPHYLNSDFLY